MVEHLHFHFTDHRKVAREKKPSAELCFTPLIQAFQHQLFLVRVGRSHISEDGEGHTRSYTIQLFFLIRLQHSGPFRTDVGAI